MRPPTFKPFLYSEYKCHSFIGIINNAGFFFCSCGFTFFNFASRIRAEADLKSEFSLSCTAMIKALGRQGSDIDLMPSCWVYKYSQGARKSSPSSEELCGISW